jgi:hypothetical protein
MEEQQPLTTVPVMDSSRSIRNHKQAYVRKMLKAQRPHGSAASGLGHLVQEGSGLSFDLFRHSLTIIGVGGLVLIAVGATTECQVYQQILNWLSSIFC